MSCTPPQPGAAAAHEQASTQSNKAHNATLRDANRCFTAACNNSTESGVASHSLVVIFQSSLRSFPSGLVQVSRQGFRGSCGVVGMGSFLRPRVGDPGRKSHQPQMTSAWDLVQKLLDQPASSASEATAPVSQTSLLDTDDKLAEALAKGSGTKKRQQTQANPNDPHPRKRPRRTYTDQEKELVIRTDARGGRRERLRVAELLGMPTRTADNLCARAHQGAIATHDRRHDGALTNRFVKRAEWQIELVKEWLH